MLQTLALAAAMSFGPAQGGLTLSNERITFGGEFGPTRPDSRYLPGDLFYFCFDIEGLKPDPRGKVQYLMGMTLSLDATGKVLFESKPALQSVTLPLGASKLPAQAFVHLGPDLKGACTCKVTVTDPATNTTKVVEKKFTILDPDFGIVAFQTTYDLEGKTAAPQFGVAGQAMWLHFLTVGFSRAAGTKQPEVAIEMRVYDLKTRQPTTEEPIVKSTDKTKPIEEDVAGLDWHLPLPLNRPGQYRVELKAIDRVSNKKYEMSFSVTVYESIK